MAAYRTIDRILAAIDGGHIYLTPGHSYIDLRTMRSADDAVYEAEDGKYVTLLPGGGFDITDKGRAWMRRDRSIAGRRKTPVFSDNSGRVA